MVAEAITEMGPPGGNSLDFFPIREDVDGIVHSQTRSMLYIVQHFPPWFPGAHHVGGIRAWRSTMQELYDYPLYTVKKQQASNL
jgi:hypothetical protein